MMLGPLRQTGKASLLILADLITCSTQKNGLCFGFSTLADIFAPTVFSPLCFGEYPFANRIKTVLLGGISGIQM